MHHAGDVAELAVEPRARGIGRVEDECLAAAEAIGEEAAVRRHFVLGVVRAVVPTGHRHRRHQPAVAAGAGSDIEDREKIRLRRVG